MNADKSSHIQISKSRLLFMLFAVAVIFALLGALVALKITESDVNRLRDKVETQKIQIEKIQNSREQ